MNSETVITMFIIPWCVWVTGSLFNQRQEIEVLKQILKTLSDKLSRADDELI